MRNILKLTAVALAIVCTVAFAQRIGRDRPSKFIFDPTTVVLPSMPNTDVTIVPEADGTVVVWFDPPVLSVTGLWFTEHGKFTCCSGLNNCLDTSSEVGGPDIWHGGVGFGSEEQGGLLQKCRFSGGGAFQIYSVIE